MLHLNSASEFQYLHDILPCFNLEQVTVPATYLILNFRLHPEFLDEPAMVVSVLVVDNFSDKKTKGKSKR